MLNLTWKWKLKVPIADITFRKCFLNHTHFPYRLMIWLLKINQWKQNKNKSNISKLFQNTKYFLLSGHLSASSIIHYKLNSMALISLQQTLKTSRERKEQAVAYTHTHSQSGLAGTSLLVQWLRLPAPIAGGPGSIPGQGTRSHVPQLRHSTAKKKKKVDWQTPHWKLLGVFAGPSSMIRYIYNGKEIFLNL